jgi:hypothetical protein
LNFPVSFSSRLDSSKYAIAYPGQLWWSCKNMVDEKHAYLIRGTVLKTAKTPCSYGLLVVSVSQDSDMVPHTVDIQRIEINRTDSPQVLQQRGGRHLV